MRILFFSLLALLLSFTHALHYINLTNFTDLVYDDTPPKLDPELKKDIEEIERVKEKAKTVACLIIARDSLSAGGNQVMKDALINTKFDRSHVFDKVLVSMVMSCSKTITQVMVDEVGYFKSRSCIQPTFSIIIKRELSFSSIHQF